MSTAVEPILALGGEPLRAALAAVEVRLLELGSLSEPAAQTIAAGGKRLRPVLVLVAAGDAHERPELMRAAVAVELIHAATLVHDDVLDGAPLRRGRATVFADRGRASATATGDLLFSRAFAELALNASAAQLALLSSASSALAQGELMQRADAWSADVSVARYLERCELKTARLFAAACSLGRLAGGSGELAGLDEFGLRIGLAFQLLDDILDVTGPAERIGKRRGSDLLDGTVTLPLILAREQEPELARERVRDAEEAERICDRIVALGAIEPTRERALALVDEAKGMVAALPPAQLAMLELVADGVVARYA